MLAAKLEAHKKRVLWQEKHAQSMHDYKAQQLLLERKQNKNLLRQRKQEEEKLLYQKHREMQERKFNEKLERLRIEAEINETEAELKVLDSVQNGFAYLVQAEPKVYVRNKEVPTHALMKDNAHPIRDQQFKEPPAVSCTIFESPEPTPETSQRPNLFFSNLKFDNPVQPLLTPIITVAALPPVEVESPVFNRSSAECCAFIDAFDNLISTIVSSRKRKLLFASLNKYKWQSVKILRKSKRWQWSIEKTRVVAKKDST